ncbi:M61 family metallopeptidase [Flavihumibacter petaseus]|uniref:Peptidase M61 family protein n=1 Tax=Flavihumibacter petaseus NBRC 106054 TaxID=1220578 RepID=A0A0E9MZH8_9BACT|nr:hypothetical protein [Flavihumibacter petaseus]GAO42515.1 hypothetical protein FPE01S_01_15300 [Flavihumibacter petaseus NBRC 106054]
MFWFTLLTVVVAAQPRTAGYQFTVDLRAVDSDRLMVHVKLPALSGVGSKLVWAFPRIIPGTYRISDFGQFISQVKAYDRQGRLLPVKKIDTNRWQINGTAQPERITYLVDDIVDTEKKHNIYAMSASNIEAGMNFVLNTPAFFGYLEGYTQLPVRLEISKPETFYGATSMMPIAQTNTSDVFEMSSIDALYDGPLLYAVPDTTVVTVGNCRVLVAVYSPNHKITSAQIASWLEPLLRATQAFLGGKLPTDQYAFLYYFRDPNLKHSFPNQNMGALEHTRSSFYYLPEMSADALQKDVTDMSSHEFFHIITPLTIASKEIKQFNFSRPVLSQHLWLYEGATEYFSRLVQAQYGLKSTETFLGELVRKIVMSRNQFNDKLPFTVLSKESAGKYADQYVNVYQKGALIAACLDLQLLHRSQGRYGLRELARDLGNRYGKDSAFNDAELFGEIGRLTGPETEAFLQRYVAGGEPIPYEYYLGLAGVKYAAEAREEVYTLGGFGTYQDAGGWLWVDDTSELNAFGKKMGYQPGDKIVSVNGELMRGNQVPSRLSNVKKQLHLGDTLRVRVVRKSDSIWLVQPVEKVTVIYKNQISLQADASAEALVVQQAWLKPAASFTTTGFVPQDTTQVGSTDAYPDSGAALPVPADLRTEGEIHR